VASTKKKEETPKEGEQKVTAIEGAEAIQPKNIQEIAKANYEKAEALAKEGKEPPPLPATPVNLASFQNRENLPEQKRKELEPREIAGHKEKQAENQAKKADNEGSVTDSILGGHAQDDGQPTGPAVDLGGRSTPPVRTDSDR
jgi:hypothetical protein